MTCNIGVANFVCTWCQLDNEVTSPCHGIQCNEYLLSPPQTLDKPSQNPKCPWHEPPSHKVLPKTLTPNTYFGET